MSRIKASEEVLAFVCISVHPREHYPHVVNDITKINSVKEIYGITGEYDILIKLQAKSVREFSEILGKIGSLSGVAKTYTMLVVDLIKP
ncbi:MAG: Lrp/AsnC ligand binding domain-containing protein [Candidatus Nezhaarchaeales archaeon]